MKRGALILIAALLASGAISGCGQRVKLRPAPGAELPPKPAMAGERPTVDTLLDTPTTARPDRSDDVLRRSQDRPKDPFNLPPPG